MAAGRLVHADAEQLTRSHPGADGPSLNAASDASVPLLRGRSVQPRGTEAWVSPSSCTPSHACLPSQMDLVPEVCSKTMSPFFGESKIVDGSACDKGQTYLIVRTSTSEVARDHRWYWRAAFELRMLGHASWLGCVETCPVHLPLKLPCFSTSSPPRHALKQPCQALHGATYTLPYVHTYGGCCCAGLMAGLQPAQKAFQQE